MTQFMLACYLVAAVISLCGDAAVPDWCDLDAAAHRSVTVNQDNLVLLLTVQ